MIMPLAGKVVIVDDEIKEAEPLINVLSQNKIPFSYFSGQLDQLPDSPLKGIRVIFMDLKLGFAATSDDSKAIRSNIFGVIDKIIHKSNGPYVLILWSKHGNHYIKDIEVSLKNDKKLKILKPILLLTLDKNIYMKFDDESNIALEDNALENIKTALLEKISQFDVFKLFLLWENVVNKSITETVADLSSYYPLDDNWNENIKTIFCELAKAEAEQHLSSMKPDEKIIASICTFNKVFIDVLERNVLVEDYNDPNLQMDFFNETGVLDLDIKAKLNTNLILEEDTFNKESPGNIYVDSRDNEERFCHKKTTMIFECIDNNALIHKVALNCKTEISDCKQFIKDHKKDIKAFREEICSNSKVILLEVSPLCDFAQNKWKRNRLLPGVLINIQDSKMIKKAEYLYKTPLLYVEDKRCILVFDFRYMTSIKNDELKMIDEGGKSLCRVRNTLLTDIQAHLARHINRPGIQSL